MAATMGFHKLPVEVFDRVVHFLADEPPQPEEFGMSQPYI